LTLSILGKSEDRKIEDAAKRQAKINRLTKEYEKNKG
jgi:hypothetical protein